MDSHSSIRAPGHRRTLWLVGLLAGLFALTGSADSVRGQVPELRPGDARIDPERIEEHVATHRFITYGDQGEQVVGRLTRNVERVNHTEGERAILVSMQFRSPTRSGLDIAYLDAATLAGTIRYLTAPTGMTTVYQTPEALHVTYAGQNGQRVNADTTLTAPWFAGADDLLLASLDVEDGEVFSVPILNGAAQTLHEGMQMLDFRLEGRERLEVPGVWSGDTRRFVAERPDGTRITYWISDAAPHLIRQDFTAPGGQRFLRWELEEYEPAGDR